MDHFNVNPNYLPSEHARKSIDSGLTMELLSSMGITSLSNRNHGLSTLKENEPEEEKPPVMTQETSTSMDEQPPSFAQNLLKLASKYMRRSPRNQGQQLMQITEESASKEVSRKWATRGLNPPYLEQAKRFRELKLPEIISPQNKNAY
jgi:hypothetical protein